MALVAQIFLLSVLALPKPNTLQGFWSEANHKRAACGIDPVAVQLTTLVYKAVLKKYPSGQFAVLYLQPKSANNALDYQNPEVKTVLTPGSPVTLCLTTSKVWPQTPSNLAVAIPAKSMQYELGHSETRVLKKLDEMMIFFKKENAPDSCPPYVIIATKLAPCYTVPKGGRQPYGCTKQIISKAKTLRPKCPHTKFVVGYSDLIQKYVENWRMAENLLTNEGIIIVKIQKK